MVEQSSTIHATTCIIEVFRMREYEKTKSARARAQGKGRVREKRKREEEKERGREREREGEREKMTRGRDLVEQSSTPPGHKVRKKDFVIGNECVDQSSVRSITYIHV